MAAAAVAAGGKRPCLALGWRGLGGVSPAPPSPGPAYSPLPGPKPWPETTASSFGRGAPSCRGGERASEGGSLGRVGVGPGPGSIRAPAPLVCAASREEGPGGGSGPPRDGGCPRLGGAYRKPRGAGEACWWSPSFRRYLEVCLHSSFLKTAPWG